MNSYRPFLMGLVLCLCGCTSESTTPLPLEDFCGTWVEAYCEGALACRCVDELTLETCMAQPCPIGAGSNLRGAIDAGTLSYDADRAAAYVASLRPSSCQADPRGGLFLMDYQTLFGTLDGTLLPGEACEVGPGPDGCLGGLCDAERGVCVGRAARGEACGDLIACHVPADGDPERALRCIEGLCLPLREVGESCGAHADCRLGPCESDVCVDGRDVGASCDDNLECGSRRCDFATAQCRAQVIEGELCGVNSECASGGCAGREMHRAGQCANKLPTGEACTENAGCLTNVCITGICRAPVCLRAD